MLTPRALPTLVCFGAVSFVACGGPDVRPDAATRHVPMDAATGDAAPGDAGEPDAGFMPAPHPPFPVLTRRGDAELTAPRLVVIVGPSEPSASELFAFGDALVSSAWLAAVGADYGVSPAWAASLHLAGAAMPASMNFGDLAAYVDATVAAHPEATPDGRSIYLVFYQPGTSYPDSCRAYGAHDTLLARPPPGAATDELAYVQRCAHAPGLSDLDYLTSVASHEVIESATDSNPPAGYLLPTALDMVEGSAPPWSIPSWSYLQPDAIEDGDLCEGTLIHEGAFAYQRSWSVAAAAAGGDPCVPALPLAYFSVSTPTDWVDLPAGTTTMVPITGWSTDARPDWSVTVDYTPWTPTGFDASFAGAAPTTSIQNGRTAMLAVTTPPTPGEFAVFRLDSSASGPMPDFPQPATGDAFHSWLFGVHTTCASGCPAAPASCGDATCDTGAGENCTNCPDDCGACGQSCGGANFGISCAGTPCPTHSHCLGGSGCMCDTGFVAQPCHGTSCPPTGCAFPDYWCVPAACGAANFDTACSGGGTCPSAATCEPMNHCRCNPGTQDTTCDGQPCPSGGCSYPNWWCTSCGAANFIVTCAGGGTCPAFSTCNTDGTCSCMSGYHDVACDGTSCAGGCSYPDWWCAKNL